MSDIEKGRWQLDGADAAALLEKLPSVEKVMLVLRENGATHERIGPVGTVTRDGTAITLGGDVHTAKVDTGLIDRVVLDTTSVMQGNAYPKVEFQDSEGVVLFSAIAMAGPDGFMAAVGTGPRTEIAPSERRMPSPSAQPEDMSDDAGFTLLDTLSRAAEEVEIRMALSGRQQSWTGQIETVKPAMGFANVMTPDFHLHLKAGAVSEWRSENGSWVALGPDGLETGLVVTSAGAGA